MKKFLLALCVAVMAVGTASALEKGDKALGINVLYGSEVGKMGVGVKGQYVFHERWRGEASFNYFFKNKNDQHMWDLNVTAHYLVPLGEKARVYPLAGPTIASSTNENGSEPNTSITKFGLNLGGGFEYELSDNFTLGLEARYSIVSAIDQFVVGIGATYRF